MRVTLRIAMGLVVASLCGVWHAQAQIVVIPQEQVREAANPTLAAEAQMLFEEGTTLSVGTIGEEDAAWSGTIHWRDGRGRKLTITRITTSCSCVVAKWDKRAKASSEGSIEISFLPKGRIGNINQRLLIYTSLDEKRPTATITLEGRVTPSRDHSTTHPYTMGELRLRRKSITFGRNGGVERIAVVNGGSRPLRLTHDPHLTSPGIRAYAVPEVLAPGCEGDLMVEWEGPSGRLPMLHIGGVDAPVRERKIEINTKE